MNLFKSILTFCVSVFILSNVGLAQNSTATSGDNSTPEWVIMMQDQNVNFYDVQKSANNYYETHPKGKGSGWKQFKRWEYFTEQRVYPSGDRINHAQV